MIGVVGVGAILGSVLGLAVQARTPVAPLPTPSPVCWLFCNPAGHGVFASPPGPVTGPGVHPSGSCSSTTVTVVFALFCDSLSDTVTNAEPTVMPEARPALSTDAILV